MKKNVLIWSIHFWDTADFTVSRPKNPRPFLTNTMQELLMQLLNFLNFYQYTKNQLAISIPSWDTANVSVLGPDWQHSFLIIPTPILSNQILISQAFSSFCSRVYLCIYSQLKNTAIWVESILVYISRTRTFPRMWFVQEYSKYYKISL